LQNTDTNTLQHAPGFIDYLQFEKRYSTHTLRAYHDDLLQFSTYLVKEYGGIADTEIRPPIIRSWLATLKDEGLTAKSLNRKISSLRSYFRFLLKKKFIQQSPVAQITSPRISKRLPVFVAQKDMETLLSPELYTDDKMGRMRHLVLTLFYHTGVRLSELIHIKISDIDYKRHSLKVLGKGNKERIIPLTPVLAQTIKNYLEADVAETPRVYLFETEKGTKLYPGYVYKLVKTELQKVTTIQKKSPHVLRHSFATHLSNNGAELNAIKELLGHASLAATQVYTHNTIDKLKEIHAKAHPKS
jgi:integrase/recombinase XerC